MDYRRPLADIRSDEQSGPNGTSNASASASGVVLARSG